VSGKQEKWFLQAGSSVKKKQIQVASKYTNKKAPLQTTAFLKT
jgi:hypothetical protein